MDITDFLTLQRIDEQRWQFEVTERVITPGKFLYGGCGLAASVVALEGATQRPTIYAAAHYLSYASLGSLVDVVVDVAVKGKRVTQARATTFVDDREILTVNAALGTGELNAPTPWVVMPSVPSPEECPRFVRHRRGNSIFDHVETRIALGRSFDELDGAAGLPVSALWARAADLDISAATMAIFGDLVSGGATQPLGRPTMGRSLDNTIRIASLEASDWVLCEIHMHALMGGFAQGTGFLWSDRGVLLATASQSLSSKYFDPSEL